MFDCAQIPSSQPTVVASGILKIAMSTYKNKDKAHGVNISYFNGPGSWAFVGSFDQRPTPYLFIETSIQPKRTQVYILLIAYLLKYLVPLQVSGERISVSKKVISK